MAETNRICRIEGCEKPRHAHGMCQMHNRRRQVTGDPLVRSLHGWIDCRIRWVSENAQHDSDECLPWPFSKGDHGRGVVQIGGRIVSAPRYMCSLAHGEPPTPEHQASHSCGKGHEGCMNPRHLRWATAQENEADKVTHGTARRGEKVNTAILSATQVLEIRRRVESESGVKLAAEFGVSTYCISDIKRRRSWAWL